jgi:hypothetical protein
MLGRHDERLRGLHLHRVGLLLYLVLFNRKDEFLDRIFEELRVLCPTHLHLLDPRVDTKQPCLVQLLRFD